MKEPQIVEKYRCEGTTKKGLPCKARAMKETRKEGRKRYCHNCNPEVEHPRPMIEAKIQEQHKAISRLLRQNYTVMEIAEKLDIHRSTVYDRVSEMASFLKENGAARDEAIMGLVMVKQEALRMAYADFAILRTQATGEDGKIKPDYPGMDKAIRIITDTAESLEKTYARLGLVPPEPRRLDMSAQIDTRSEEVHIFIEGYTPNEETK